MQTQTILHDLEGANRLPSPPQVALKIVEMIGDPNTGLQDISDVIQNDQAISAKLLQIANSASYSRGREILTLTDAVSQIGTKSVSVIALGFSLKEALPLPEEHKQASASLWEHSVATAVVCRSISRFVGGLNNEMAFMCGLLSRVGQLVLLTQTPDYYLPTVAAAAGMLPTAEEERSTIGITHHKVSELLLDKWHFPKAIVNAIARWGDETLDDSLSDEDQKLIGIVQVADVTRRLLFDEERTRNLERLHDLAHARLSIAPTEIDRIFVTCQLELQETIKIFADRHVTFDCEGILAEAKNLLVRLSMELSTEVLCTQQENLELKRANSQLREECLHDALTRLPNRFALDKELEALDEHLPLPADGREYTVIMLDVDHFKVINDTFGHATGDIVLQSVGHALQECSRCTDFVARYGGEEFTVILPNCTAEEAMSVAERFRLGVQALDIVLESGERVEVTVSLGFASTDQFPEDTRLTSVLKYADESCYVAKRKGRNCSVAYAPPQEAEHKNDDGGTASA